MRIVAIIVCLFFFTLPVFAQTSTADDVDEAKALRLFSVMMPEARAKDHIRKLRELAARTPYSAALCLSGAHRWAIWDWNETDTLKGLQAAADAAASVSGDDDAFSRIAYALGEMGTETKYCYSHLLALERAGLPVFQILGKKVGQSAALMREYAEAGRLKPKETSKLLVEGMGESFRDLAADNLRKNGKAANRK